MTSKPPANPKNTGRFAAGNPGKPKGAVSKINADVKAMLEIALHHAGGAEYLCMQAFDNPKAFLALVGRLVPTQVTGRDGAPIEVAHAVLDETAIAARVQQLVAVAEARRRAAEGDS